MPRTRTLILVSAFLFSTQLLEAQQPQVEFRELLVQIPGIESSRGLPDIKSKLSDIPGLYIVAFCESQHLVMMKIERKRLPENKPVYDAISELGYKFYVKEGATISQAKNTCKDKKLTVYPTTDLPSE